MVLQWTCLVKDDFTDGKLKSQIFVFLHLVVLTYSKDFLIARKTKFLKALGGKDYFLRINSLFGNIPTYTQDFIIQALCSIKKPKLSHG